MLLPFQDLHCHYGTYEMLANGIVLNVLRDCAGAGSAAWKRPGNGGMKLEV